MSEKHCGLPRTLSHTSIEEAMKQSNSRRRCIVDDNPPTLPHTLPCGGGVMQSMSEIHCGPIYSSSALITPPAAYIYFITNVQSSHVSTKPPTYPHQNPSPPRLSIQPQQSHSPPHLIKHTLSTNLNHYDLSYICPSS